MDYFTRYVYLVFLVKIIFISLALYGLVLKKGKKQDKGTKAREAQVTYWKERIEFVFIALMSLLLIYIFFPRSNRINLINAEVKLLFYLFGFVLLITAKWENFIHDSTLLRDIQSVLGRT